MPSLTVHQTAASTLIADLDPEVRACLRRLVAGAGHTITAEVALPDDLLAEFLRVRPDVILVDALMVGNAPGLVGEIALVDPRARIIVLAAELTRRQARELLVAGAFNILTKPLRVSRLHAAVVEAAAS